MILSLSPVELFAYALMGFLGARAIGHHFEARMLRQMVRPVEHELENIAKTLADCDPELALLEAQRATRETPLAAAFENVASRAATARIARVDRVIDDQFGGLYARCEHNEQVAPRWALAATALGIMLTLLNASGENGGVGSVNFRDLGLSMVSSAIGIAVANVERWTIGFLVVPLAERTRRTCISLIEGVQLMETVGTGRRMIEHEV